MIVKEYRPEYGWVIRKVADKEKLVVMFYYDGDKQAEYYPESDAWKTGSINPPLEGTIKRCLKFAEKCPDMLSGDYNVKIRKGRVEIKEAEAKPNA